jgi:hypothetical protein
MQYATSPGEALDLASDFITSADRVLSGHLRFDEHESFRQPEAVRQMYLRDMSPTLPVLWVAKETSELISSAAESYPLSDAPVPPSMFPSGLFCFEKPQLFIPFGEDREPIQALAWVWVHDESDNCDRLFLRGLNWAQGAVHVTWWRGNTTQTTDAVHLTITRWLYAADAFMAQKVFTASPEHLPRHAVKRAVRAGRTEPHVYTVALRRKEQSERSSREAAGVEWAHRWLVQGHWRNQWFPKRNTHSPVWIHPHVKGPDDKPFLPPSYRVFKVHR